MLHINLKVMECKEPCKQYSVLTHILNCWGGVKRSNFLSSESAHVAYQIKGKLEDLTVLKRSPDLLINVKIGQDQLRLIMKFCFMGVAAILVK